MYKEADSNDPQVILTHAIEQMKVEQGDKFDINKINLAELSRRTGISRGKEHSSTNEQASSKTAKNI